ncbi:GerAB/ArcD/ProY family transporter [Neomoorella thermoacetica]|uniref:GerAB/ArcD/ProY family transporter n=1 Tax=Neomoorella thermoacetica TaxID=1525 RepID=UPI0008FB7787|nr:GerAB/ArcD/ProY family transporter [Moorella thermoacetica]APC08130.1 spore germination protein YndE [Moorella thermoacetica]
MRERIGTNEATFLIVAAMIEVGTLKGARNIVEKVGVDTWLVSPLETIFSLGAIYLLTRLVMKFPDLDLVGFSRRLVGKWLAWLLGLIVLVYWVGLTAEVGRVTADTIKSSLLSHTPDAVVLSSYLLVAAYLAGKGLEPLARASIIIVIFTLPITLLLFALVIPRIHLDNFLPILPHGPWPVIKLALWRISNAEEMSLFLILVPFLKDPRQAWRAASYGFLTVMAVVITIITTCQGVLGVDQLKYTLIPGLTVTQLAEFAGAFIERISLIFISVWIILVFPTASALLWASSYLLGRLLNLKDYKMLAFYQLPVVYYLAWRPGNSFEVKRFFFFLQPLGLVVLVGIPSLLYLVALFRCRAR